MHMRPARSPSPSFPGCSLDFYLLPLLGAGMGSQVGTRTGCCGQDTCPLSLLLLHLLPMVTDGDQQGVGLNDPYEFLPTWHIL